MTNDEIVCTCMSVSVKDIRNAIEQGAKDFAQIQKITGLGSVCGVCTDDAESIVSILLKEYGE